MAIVDHWKIEEDCPFELMDSENENQEDAETSTFSHYNAIETLAAYLSTEDKKKLCHIIGRNYCEKEFSPIEEKSSSESLQIS